MTHLSQCQDKKRHPSFWIKNSPTPRRQFCAPKAEYSRKAAASHRARAGHAHSGISVLSRSSRARARLMNGPLARARASEEWPGARGFFDHRGYYYPPRAPTRGTMRQFVHTRQPRALCCARSSLLLREKLSPRENKNTRAHAPRLLFFAAAAAAAAARRLVA